MFDPNLSPVLYARRPRHANSRRPCWRTLGGLYRLFLLGTIFVVWIEHRPVFVAGGLHFKRLKDETPLKFFGWTADRRICMKCAGARESQSLKQRHTNRQSGDWRSRLP